MRSSDVFEDANVDYVREGIICGSLASPYHFLGAAGYKSCLAGNRTRFSRICMMTLRRYFFVGWASDFVNVHDDAYCFSLVLGFTEIVTAFLLPFSFLHVARCTFCQRAEKKKRGRLVTAIPRFLFQLCVCLFICGQSLIHGL